MTTTFICVTIPIPGIKAEGYQYDEAYELIGNADPKRKQLDELITETFDAYLDRYEYDLAFPQVDYYYETNLPLGVVQAEFDRNPSLRGLDPWLGAISS